MSLGPHPSLRLVADRATPLPAWDEELPQLQGLPDRQEVVASFSSLSELGLTDLTPSRAGLPPCRPDTAPWEAPSRREALSLGAPGSREEPREVEAGHAIRSRSWAGGLPLEPLPLPWTLLFPLLLGLLQPRTLHASASLAEHLSLPRSASACPS